ncbi:S1/P1 nuclease, partial [Gaertneriomyces semiglobifer]
GHWMSGWIAEQYLTPQAVAYARYLLPRQNGSLADACLWADEIKGLPRRPYDWSNSLHYINPVSECKQSIEPSDCTHDRCVVSGMFNYTTRLLDHTLTRDQKEEALKFLIHFVGDVHQPLHASGRAEGGTRQHVTFDRKRLSLHQVWDFSLFEKHINDDFRGSKYLYADYLLAELNNTYGPSLPDWDKCSTSKPDFPLCPEDWALDASQVSCKAVWPSRNDLALLDLAGEYYKQNIKIAEYGLMQAGMRIAWV